MSKRLILIIAALCGLLSMSISVPNVQAFSTSGSDTVGYNGYNPLRIELEKRDSVKYSVTIIEGYYVDIFLMDEYNYGLYRNKDYYDIDYLINGTQIKTKNIEIDTQLEPGTYFIVIDNTYYKTYPNIWQDDGQVDYNYWLEVGQTGFDDSLLLGIAITVIVIVLITAILIIRKRKMV